VRTNSLKRQALFGSSALVAVALLASQPAFAQEKTAADEKAADEEIVVTGTLIKNPNLVSSQPVTVTTSDVIQLRASNVAEEVLRDIPGIVPSIGSAVNNGNGGASYVNLRGLGSNRNLVLLDGNRLAPSELAGRVDLNNIPLALVERVDALTGAAVTTYGADAITGVVNFVTKRSFTGVELNTSYGITELGDGNYFRTDLTIGGDFDGGKGNAVVSVGYQKSDPVYQGDRGFSSDNIDSTTGLAGGSGTSVPFRLSGLRPIDPATGLPSTNPAVANVNGQFDPANGFGRALYAPFNFNPYNIFQTPFERFNIFAQARYEVSDAVEFYSRAMFSKNTVQTIIAPSGLFGSSVTINLNNPFLPAGIRSQICAGNIGTTTNYIPRFTAAECAAAATATGPSDPNYRTYTGALARRTTEFGPRISNYQTTFFDYQAGLRGAVNSHINWDVSAAYGQSENIQTTQGYVLISKARNTLLANNTTTCISTDPGCVPVNWFGPGGTINPAAASYVTGSATIVNTTSLGQVRGLLSGDLGFATPWGADPISFALGAEYRNYVAKQRSDQTAKSGDLGGFGGAPQDISGSYDVKEVYGELIVPVVQDKPLFENLTLEGGARYSSYKVNATPKRSFDAFTWKVGGSWTPVQGIKLRGNYSRAVRAPNIGELFAPVQSGLTSLSIDPCSGNRPVNNATLRAVCLLQGAPTSSIGSIENPTAAQAQSQQGGNPGLKPEKADTWTVGIVAQPSFIPGLAVTLDYFRISVRDAVSSPSAQNVIDLCFGSAPGYSLASVNNPACARSQIGRNALTGGLDGEAAVTPGLNLPLSNLGYLKTSGVDLTLAYSRDIGFAKLGVTANGTWTIDNKFRATPVSAIIECVTVISPTCGSLQPRFQSQVRTTLSFKPADISLLWRHMSSFAADPAVGALPAFSRIRPYEYFDFTTRFHIIDNITLTATVANLFDQKPPYVGSTIGSTAFNSGNTYPSTYDALGRRYTVQLGVRF
jgi:outer membrane receptor protein involved in Fe transport